MKAILIKSDKALSYEFVPDPEVKADDILIKVKGGRSKPCGSSPKRGKIPVSGWKS